MSCFRTASGLCFNHITHFRFTNDHRDDSEISESTRTLDTSFSVAFDPTFERDPTGDSIEDMPCCSFRTAPRDSKMCSSENKGQIPYANRKATEYTRTMRPKDGS